MLLRWLTNERGKRGSVLSHIKTWSFITLLVLILATPSLFAQGETTGSISGIVQDSSAAAMPNAKVTLTNNGTGESAKLVITTANTPVMLTTAWTNLSTSVGVTVSDGFNAAIDNLRYFR